MVADVFSGSFCLDPLTQGTLGAALPQSLARSVKIKHAAILGCLSGMAPDIDVFFQSPTDPLLFLEFHRQFTHALLFIPFGALICAALFHRVVRKSLQFRETYLFCLLGYATHGLLDACTTYGTQLFWPISNVRIAWNNVSVVDPLVTLPLLALVLTSVWRRKPVFAQIGLAWVVCYLLIGVVQRDRAIVAGESLAASRGHQPTRLEAKPGFANLLLWKVVYETEDRFYVDAVRVGFTTASFPGQSAEKLDVSKHFPDLIPTSQQAVDIERFRWFSNDYVALSPVNNQHIIDVRYSMIPNEIDPLWYINIAPDVSDHRHVEFITNRNAGPDQVSKLLNMLRPPAE
jgi:inner membrane protein